MHGFSMWYDKIPVNEIIDIWRSESVKGRYEGEIWKAHMLKLAVNEIED
eukprot:CAMPEP_0119334718 /NCGR_PEP_ID=MMETSP1333-20130426/87905_1 /TAXON_ID=418940 /ORGANISM="Scyphosphaera apsteinii, Strain RCC1455" /LENGTH=48 /DNA_ID= /DNA_START= /DNA_END= /DNA_ORIENTATION=